MLQSVLQPVGEELKVFDKEVNGATGERGVEPVVGGNGEFTFRVGGRGFDAGFRASDAGGVMGNNDAVGVDN
jgi:hypothetical protein